MPVIQPVPWDDLEPELREVIVSGQRSRMLSGDAVPVRIWAHRSGPAKAWLRTMAEMHEHSCLDERLRELVRLRIASHTQCRACQTSRKSNLVTEEDIACLSSDDARFTNRERAAIRFADLFAGDYFSIRDEMFDEMAQHFRTDEIIELVLFSGLMLAGGRVTHVLRGYDDAAEDNSPPITSERSASETASS